MQQDIGQTNPYDDEINLFEIIDQLIKSKNILIVTTLIFTISAFIYSLQNQSTYQSSVLIEIGHYEKNKGSIELVEKPKSLIQDLNINLKYKVDSDLSGAQINVVEDRLIEIQHSSKSAEKNIDILNQFINYLDIRHSSLANEKYLEKRAELTEEFDNISSEIEFMEKLLLAQNEDEKLRISNQILKLINQLPYIDKQISNLEQIITQDQENLQLLKTTPNLYLERASTNPTLNQVIHSYKKELANFFQSKKTITANISILEEQLKLLESPSLQSKQVFKLSQQKDKLKIKLKDLEGQNFSNTQTIGEINTSQLDSNKTIITVLGLIVGLITGIFLVFVSNFVKTYRKRKA